MKRNILRLFDALVIVMLLAFSVSAVEVFDGICPICKSEGKTSKVYPGPCSTTAMFCGNGYYDELGKYHFPEPCNTTTCEYLCSNGHHFTR